MTTVGLFDSGVGGLSVLIPLTNLSPNTNFIYLADQSHCPYGSLPPDKILSRSFAITDTLLSHGASLIVLACNTATSAALTALRERHPSVPFVGMEPAVKPAARQTRTGHIGVLATQTTAQSERLASLIDRFGGAGKPHGGDAEAAGVRRTRAERIHVHVHVPEGLVQLVEAGAGESDQAETLLAPTIHHWLQLGVDTIVLGCTHYPFARRTIQRLAGPTTTIIDPTPAVAHHAASLLRTTCHPSEARDRSEGSVASTRPRLTFLTTSDPLTLKSTITHLAPTLLTHSAFNHLST